MFFLFFQFFLILFHLYNTKKNSLKRKTKNTSCQLKSLIGHPRDENYHFNQIKEEKNQESRQKSLSLWYVMILFYIFRIIATNIWHFEPIDTYKVSKRGAWDPELLPMYRVSSGATRFFFNIMPIEKNLKSKLWPFLWKIFWRFLAQKVVLPSSNIWTLCTLI